MVFGLEDWLSGITNIGAGECQVADRVFFRPSIFSFGGSCLFSGRACSGKRYCFCMLLLVKRVATQESFAVVIFMWWLWQSQMLGSMCCLLKAIIGRYFFCVLESRAVE